jgi:uncharacterized protein YjiS (DUF1127 family)
MSTSTADNHFSFSLPSLSYIDTSLEDQNRQDNVHAAPTGSFAEWLARRVTAFRIWGTERRAMNELSLMTERELMDVGLNSGDFGRMFDDRANSDLRARCTI